jgi:hypothetical protein
MTAERTARRHDATPLAGAMTRLAVILLLIIPALSGTRAAETFTGVITDSMCATGDHAGMQMGPTDADCTAACIDAHGASYVLFDGRNVYELSDQRTPVTFAAQRVQVTGTLDARTRRIAVESIRAAR